MLAPVEVRTTDNLMRALGRARGAWRLAALTASAAFAVVAMAGTLASWWLAAWWGRTPGRLVEPFPAWAGAMEVALLVGGAVMLTGLVWITCAGPSLLELARKVDRELGLAERMSTAYEVVMSGGPINAVTYALLTDVESRSLSLDVSRAGALPRLNGLGTTAGVATVVAALALLVPVPQRNTTNVTASIDGPAVEAPTAAEARTITELAQVLDLVADRSRSSYLQAVADSFADLADRIDSGTVTGREARDTVTELTQHLQAAAGEVGGRFQQTVEGILAAAAPVAMPSLTDAPPSQEGSLRVAPGGPEAAAAAASGATQSLPDIYMAFDKIISEYEYDPSALGLRPPGNVQAGGAADAGFYGGVMLAETDPNAAADDSVVAGRMAGQGGGDVAGAAQMSNDRAGDAAGAGEAAVGQGSDSFLDADVEASAVAALPSNERADGAFSEVELLPAAGGGVARLLDGAAPRGSFVRSDESSLTNHAIGGSHAGVVARYFTPADRSRGDD